MEKTNPKKRATNAQLKRSYAAIIRRGNRIVFNTTPIVPEWTSEGDSFQIATMYTDFTPITTSYKITYNQNNNIDAELDGNSQGV